MLLLTMQLLTLYCYWWCHCWRHAVTGNAIPGAMPLLGMQLLALCYCWQCHCWHYMLLLAMPLLALCCYWRRHCWWNHFTSNAIGDAIVASRIAGASARALRRSLRAFTGCLGGFRWLVVPSPTARPFPRSVILWTSSVEPVPLSGTLHGFPYFWVFYNGGSGPLWGQQPSVFSLVPTSGVHPHSVPSFCLSFI